jgi:hypothetical protein
MVGAKTFPRQGPHQHKRVRVKFGDADETFDGMVVRHDAGPSGVVVVLLTDGRAILGSECAYTVIPDPPRLNERPRRPGRRG